MATPNNNSSFSQRPKANLKAKRQPTRISAESVTKTREMIRLMNECQDAGINTLQMLYDQGEQLNRTEDELDKTDEKLDEAKITLHNIEIEEKAPCCCLPCVQFCQRDSAKRKTSAITQRNNSGKKDKKAETGTNSANVGSKSKTIENGSINLTSYKNKSTANHDTIGLALEQNKLQEKFSLILRNKTNNSVIESNLSHVRGQVTKVGHIAKDMHGEVESQNLQLDRMNFKADRSLFKLNDVTKTTSTLASNKKTSNGFRCCGIL